MNAKPMLRPAFRIEVVSGEGVYLLSERDQFVLSGELYCQLAPLLDGSHHADEIVGRLAGRAAPAQIYYALNVLENKGYLVAAGDEVARDRLAFWDGLGLDFAAAQRRLADTAVTVKGLGTTCLEPLTQALETLGVRVEHEDQRGAGFVVVAADDYLHDGLAEINAFALREGRPWLLVKPTGTVLWIGPVFHPGQTACWACLAVRLRGNRRVESYLTSRDGARRSVQAAAGAAETSVAIAGHLAAVEVAKAICRGFAGSPDPDLVTIDLSTMHSQAHRVVRRPQCAECGDADRAPRRPAPVTLHSQPKRFTQDGGHRATTPEETLARYGHHISPITGAVTSLTSVSVDGDALVRYYVAAHVSPLVASGLGGLRRVLHEVSAGKGVTDAQARASGLCEALERYSGYFWGDEVRVRASYRELDTAIHPNACMLYSDRQYADCERHNTSGSIYEMVPEPFDEDAAIEWAPVWSLTAQETRYVPAEYCYAYHMDPVQQGRRYCLPDSNGNAAGNSLEEAVLQGLLELIERDSVAMWWYTMARRPAVDLDSFGDAQIEDLRRHYRMLHRDVWLLDLTSDLGIPVFAGVSRRIDGGPAQLAWGFGAHLDERIAALRALTEMSQHVPRTSSLGEPANETLDPRIRQWHSTATLAEHPYLAPADGPARHRADFAFGWGDDLRDDILRCQEILGRQGMEVLVLDQTRPDIGLPVVKVIVPGLRHFRPRLAGGRLYDVPLRLGWIDAPLTEDTLNPLPYVFP